MINMSLEYIQRKLKDIRIKRSKLLEEEIDIDSETYWRLDRDIKKMTDLKVAAIMDEFTYQSYKPEFNVLQITPNQWVDEFNNFRPDMLFIESAWQGKDGLWNAKISNLSKELIEIIGYCKINNIPIVFWNKEDPVHFETFLEVAKSADFVFTTDIDCIKKYKAKLNHERVYLLPFAAQPKIHNPIEKFERENKFCFAGAYYKRYPERAKDFETFIDTISQNYGIVIYDRNFYKKEPEYRFPKKYKKFIAGYLNPNQIDKAYKGYKFNINMNSVKQSPTMCARRVFELLASNTVVISNYSTAIRIFFGDLIVCTDDSQRLKSQIELLKNEEYYRKLRLAGLRKVLAQHTYSNRARYLVSKVYGKTMNDDRKMVAIVSIANSRNDIIHIVDAFKRQNYRNLKLFIQTTIYDSDIPENVVLVHPSSKEWLSELHKEFDYIAFFSNKDYYGPNYIFDFMLASNYIDAEIITKSVYFLNNENGICKIYEGKEYTSAISASIRRSVVKCSVLDVDSLQYCIQYIDNARLDNEKSCFSIDEYNYCMNYYGNECPVVDDLKIADTGVSIENLYEIAESIKVEPDSSNYRDNGQINSILLNNDKGYHLSKSKILLCINRYPSYHDLYHYPFVHSRLVEYRKRGVIIDVFKLEERSSTATTEFYGIDIMSGYHNELIRVLTFGDYNTILIHFFTESIWQGIKHSVEGKRIIIWIHGAEIQPWWRRAFNYRTKEELEKAKILSEKRMAFWKEIFQLSMTSNTYHFHFVFISKYLLQEVFEDLKIELPKEMYSVIHNYINTELFEYRVKNKEQRKKILSIRPFSSHTYANDLTVKAILELSKEKFFKELEFRIIGQGELFQSTVRPLKKFKNVILEEKILRQEEIAKLHKEYGVFLVPSRMDTQGVSRDEAMSSGLVPVTNRVGAIPEFVDASSGFLAEPEDYKGLAEGIKKLYNDPTLFHEMSKNASELVRRRCGIEQTIEKEIELILGGKESEVTR